MTDDCICACILQIYMVVPWPTTLSSYFYRHTCNISYLISIYCYISSLSDSDTILAISVAQCKLSNTSKTKRDTSMNKVSASNHNS